MHYLAPSRVLRGAIQGEPPNLPPQQSLAPEQAFEQETVFIL